VMGQPVGVLQDAYKTQRDRLIIKNWHFWCFGAVGRRFKSCRPDSFTFCAID
jgi:hypothetical protein